MFLFSLRFFVGRPDFVSFSSNILSLQWNLKPSIELEMSSFSNCIFDAEFEDDPYSKVLLSLIRCSNTSVILQIHSEKLGDMLISIENGRPVLDEQEVVSRNTRSVTNGAKKRYDDILVDDDLLFEISETAPEVSPPLALLLHVNVYLAEDWLKLHRSYAHETATQVLKNAGMILQHRSLDTKIMLENRTFELTKNIQIRVGVDSYVKLK